MKILLLMCLLLGLLWGMASTTPSPNERDNEVGNLISAPMFNEMFKYQKDPKCESQGFYCYEAFIIAARYFSGFGFATTGKPSVRKREVAAFLAQTSHQTTGGWLTGPDGPSFWGYCHIKETTNDSYCDPKWPCAPAQKYYGRGPMQLRYNFNYIKAGKALGLDLLKNPDLLATDPVVSFKTAIWYWMTSRGLNIPSCHDVIIGKWRPTKADIAARRLPGFGVITNIINGGEECGHDADISVFDRFEFFIRYCKMMGIKTGKHLHCFFQDPFTRM
ncbi:endochitinase [Cucumis sativus]|nr:endochitinase [Cucumis sativus]KAE8647626.1 hypothetical protein Csa_003179 [Cucumis sativus]